MMESSTKSQAKTVTTSVKRVQVFSFSHRTKCIILCAIGFLFYANSITNKYAMDDELTYQSNAYVQMGFAGIPKILTNDSYASYYTSMGGDPTKQLSGGRFRPLSEVIFAIEHELFGNSEAQPFIQHFVNIIAYMACILSIFFFLDKFLLKKVPWGSDIAFLSTFLFAIHPLHTEVVANIKSLDEILSMIFIMLTFMFSLKYVQSKQTKHLIWGMVVYLLALLSKEYAVTLVFFIPFMFYLLEDKDIVASIKAGIPYYAVFLVYMLLRYNAVGFHSPPPSSNVLVNPYYYATHMEKIATEWFVMGKYIGLLFFPYPLSADYSYYQIKYHHFTDISVVLSILIYLAIIVWGIMLLRKKNVLSFAVLFFLLNVLMVSNFVLDIGATMGERLVFHSSLGFVIILSYYVVKAIGDGKNMVLKTKQNILIGFMAIIGIPCFGETVIRNAQWRDDTSLFIHDVGVAPDSFLNNSNAASGFLRLSEMKGNTIPQAQAYLDSVKKYSFRALKFFPNLDAAYNKLGGVYLHLGKLDSARYYWDLTEKYHPGYAPLKSNYALLSQLYFAKAIDLGKQGNTVQALDYMKKALLHDSTNANIWYNLGGAYFTVRLYDSARYAWTKALQYQPDNADAKRGLSALSSFKQQ